MSDITNISLLEVTHRLDILSKNIQTLQTAAEQLAVTEENPLPYLSLAQAFHEEAHHLSLAQEGTPDDQYGALAHTVSNLQTIREDADADAIAQLDAQTEGELSKWN